MSSNSNAAITERRVRHLRRLIFAQLSMQHAIEGCESAINRDPPLHERAILAAGVTTIYSSPFTEGNLLGALEDEFRKFSDKDLRSTHDGMWLFRNRLHAHRDLGVTGTNQRGVEGKVHVVFVDIDVQLKITTSGSLLQWEADNFQKAKDLCVFQLTRLTKKANKILHEIAKRAPRRPGTYVLGESYP